MKMFGEVKARRTGDVLETWEALRRTEGASLSKFIGVHLELGLQRKERDLDTQRDTARASNLLRSAARLLPDHQRHNMAAARECDCDAIVTATGNQWPEAIFQWRGASRRRRLRQCMAEDSGATGSANANAGEVLELDARYM